MLNTDQLFPEEKKKNSPGALSRELVKQMLFMIEKYATHSGQKGDALNFHQVGSSPEYRDYVNTSLELQAVSLSSFQTYSQLDLSPLKDEELKAFFINIYNALVYHANIVMAMGLQGIPTTDYLAWGRLGYLVGGQKFTIHDIFHGILRGEELPSFVHSIRKPKGFEKKDQITSFKTRSSCTIYRPLRPSNAFCDSQRSAIISRPWILFQQNDRQRS